LLPVTTPMVAVTKNKIIKMISVEDIGLYDKA